MRMYNFYFSPKLSAISHPVIFYTAFQFASFFFSNISSSCEQTSRNLNLKTKKLKCFLHPEILKMIVNQCVRTKNSLSACHTKDPVKLKILWS